LPTGENLALHKQVVSWSSQYDAKGWKAANITDGLVEMDSRGWASKSGPAWQRNEWVIIDLGRSHELSCMVLQAEYAYPGVHLDNRNVREFALWGSPTGAFTGEEFLLAKGHIPALAVEEKWPVRFPARKARFVKLVGLSSYSEFVIVGELSLYASHHTRSDAGDGAKERKGTE
jgi:hypothetical protein